MSAIEELKREHRVIERMLAILEAVAVRVDMGQELPTEFFPKVVDFIRHFADRCHHGKEEDNLFPAMEKRGIPRQAGPRSRTGTYWCGQTRGVCEVGRGFGAWGKTQIGGVVGLFAV